MPGDVTVTPAPFAAGAASADADPAPTEGTNDFRNGGYGGPCPPPGDGVHRYVFRFCAIDAPLDLKPGASKAKVTDMMDGHVLEETDLIGTYER
jgi:Raf kinase inhibitor-like YbhB/YbcL family protein